MNTLRRITFAFLAILAFATFSCEKAEIVEEALVLDFGDVAVDGCGWLLELEDGDLVHATNGIPENLQQDSLKVLIDYEDAEGQFQCGLAGTTYNQIELTSIGELKE